MLGFRSSSAISTAKRRSDRSAWCVRRRTTDSTRFEAERPRRRCLPSVARHEDDRVVARERGALLDAHGQMYRVKRPQAMLDDQTICRGKDQIRPKADRADRSTLSKIRIDPCQQLAPSRTAAARCRARGARELKARDLARDDRLVTLE